MSLSIRTRECGTMFSRTIIDLKLSTIKPSGGARRDRTDDLMLAKHALSQLSYGPVTRRRMLYVEASTRSSVSPSSPYGLRRARFAFRFAWLRHAEPKAKRGGPGKT